MTFAPAVNSGCFGTPKFLSTLQSCNLASDAPLLPSARRLQRGTAARGRKEESTRDGAIAETASRMSRLFRYYRRYRYPRRISGRVCTVAACNFIAASRGTIAIKAGRAARAARD